jgi:hypothetical protein
MRSNRNGGDACRNLQDGAAIEIAIHRNHVGLGHGSSPAFAGATRITLPHFLVSSLKSLPKSAGPESIILNPGAGDLRRFGKSLIS